MSRILSIAVVAAAAMMAGPAAAVVRTRAVAYKDGRTVLEGFLAYDDAAGKPGPAVLVVHEWWGLNAYAKTRARQLAGMGYVAFAVDMYGKGVLAMNRTQARKLAGNVRSNRKLMRRRILAALNVVKSNPRVDAKRIAAMGYCFGGTVVLELARSGADVAGVVSFHGGLGKRDSTDRTRIKSKVLVLTGADDRSVPMPKLAAFADEMRQGKVDYQIIIYGGAVHSFSNPLSGNNPSSNVAYNVKADKRSWQAMKGFFVEILSQAPRPAAAVSRVGSALRPRHAKKQS